jgi:hypothetical protein
MIVVGLAFAQPEGTWGSSFAGFREATSELVSAVVEHGYRRIGVLPYLVVTSDAPDRDLPGGSLKAQNGFLASSLRQALAEQAGGRFEVPEGDQVNNALYELKSGDLGQPDTVRKIARRAGNLDALVYGTVRDQRESTRGRAEEPDLTIVCRLISVAEGSAVAEARQDLFVSIAGAAYAGESFELRRWEGPELKNVGFHPRTEYDWTAATDFFNQGKYKDICRRRPHPVDDPNCPYRMSVIVDEDQRQPVSVGRDYFVPLEAGDQFSIRLDNRTNHGVYAALFVDGINVLGKRAEHPGNCQYWFIPASDWGRFRGWYSTDEKRYLEEAFRIGQADDSVAVRQGHLGKLGQLTAVFYSVGQPKREATYVRKEYLVPGRTHSQIVRMPDGSIAATAPADPPERRVAVVPGPSRFVDLEMYSGQRPGLILAAITLHYGTRSEIQRLQSTARVATWVDEPNHREPVSVMHVPDDDGPADTSGSTSPARRRSPGADSSHGLRFGMSGRRTPQSAQYGGVEVTMVVPGSPAAALRCHSDGKNYYLVPGRDIITHVNGEQVTTNEELNDAVRRSPREMTIRVYDRSTQSADDYDVTLSY